MKTRLLLVIGIMIISSGMMVLAVDNYLTQSHDESILNQIMIDCYDENRHNPSVNSSDNPDKLRFRNDTHFIDNVDCMWTENDVFVSDAKPINAFSNGITEIINPKHGQLKYYVTQQVIDDEYLGKTVTEWQNVEQSELEMQHEVVSDHKFYYNLGQLLMKNEMTYQIQMLGIENADDDFVVLSGYSLDSLPPHIGFSSIIRATDGRYYLLQGGTHANQVNYYKTTQLQYPDETKFPEIKSITSVSHDGRVPRISIAEVDGKDLKSDPYHVILSEPGSVEFFNETPGKLTVYLNREGVEEFSFATSQSISTRSNSGMTFPFDEPGVYSFHAKVPTNINGKEYELNAGGAITVLAEDMGNLPKPVQMEIAKMMLISSGLPISSMGQQGTDDVISIRLNGAIEKLLPESKPYYVKAAQHLMPFDIKIVLR